MLGNHDDERDMPAALSDAGFVVLQDARTQITSAANRSTSPACATGRTACADIARVVRGASPTLILLAHTPKRLIEAAALSVPLLLSGHTHGGQIVLPGIGAIAAREFPIVAGAGAARTRPRS